MKKSKKFMRLIVLLFVVAFALVSVFAFAACGGDDNSGDLGNGGSGDGEHDAEASSDDDFFFNMFKSLFSGRYSITSKDLEFGEEGNNGYKENFKVDDVEAYAVYGEENGLRVFLPDTHISDFYINSSGTQYFYDWYVNGYGDGEYFYYTFEDDESRIDTSGTEYEYNPDIKYVRYSYDYLVWDCGLDEVVDYIEAMEKATISDTFDAVDLLLSEYLSSSFMGAMTKEKTAYGYAMTLDLQKVSDLNKSLYEDTLSEIFEKVFGDGEYAKMLENVEKLLDGKVEDEVDNLLKYGEDYGITKDMVSELINIFTDYGDLDEFMEEYDGQNETVADAFGWDANEVLEEIGNYGAETFYVALDGEGWAEEDYNDVQKWIDAFIDSEVSFVFDTYADGTLIDLEIESEYATVAPWDNENKRTLYASGKITIGFDAVMPDDFGDSIKTEVESKLSELDTYMRGKIAESEDGEYVFYSYTNEKMWATLEDGGVVIHYTWRENTDTVKLSEIGYFEFEPRSDYDYFRIRHHGEITGGFSRSFNIAFDSTDD